MDESTLVLEIRPGDTLVTRSGLKLELVRKPGNKARLRFVAPKNEKIELIKSCTKT